MIKIEPPEGTRATLVIGLVILGIGGLCTFLNVIKYLTSFWDGVSIILLIVVLFAVCFVPLAIASSRTFVLDENGCTVSLWRFQKTYRWEDMKTKQQENFGAAWRSIGWMNEGIVFCVHRTKRPLIIPVVYYCAFRHPFSYIYIEFKKKKPDGTTQSSLYAIDEQELKTHLNEWGVQLDKRRG